MTRTIGILIFPEFQLLDAAGPIAAFELASRSMLPPAYRLRVLARVAGPVASSSGVALIAEHSADVAALDTLIVAGGPGAREAEPCRETLAWLRAVAPETRRVTSVCTGAFLLAAAGLLDGRRATTHWQRAALFARRYPQVRVEPDRIYVRDGNIWTSAGITAGIDLALALIADDLGDEAAKRTAQQLVVYHRRPGGQSQFSALIELGRPDGRFGGLLDWVREPAARTPARRAACRRGGNEPAQFRPRLCGRNRHDPGQGGRASASRGGARRGRNRQRADRPRRGANRLRRPGTHAARLHPRLRPAASGIAPHRSRNVIRLAYYCYYSCACEPGKIRL